MNRLPAGVLPAALALTLAASSAARPPRDDYLNPRLPGQTLTLIPFVGPGFRAVYEGRIDIEPKMSDLTLQLSGTVAPPFSQIAASADARFFLFTFGVTVGYQNEWRSLRFNPDPRTGRDRAGQEPAPEPPARGVPSGQPVLPADRDPTTTFVDLDRDARAVKDASSDVGVARFPFAEGRVGFLVPGYGFMGVTTLTVHQDSRPDVSFDWDLGTVLSHGTSYRWEGLFLFRERNTGFFGPAVRAVYLPRNRVAGPAVIGPEHVIVPDGSACQMDEAVPCRRVHELELHYGVVAGINPGWGNGRDTLVARLYTTYGLENRTFGLHTFRQPLQILVAYLANLDL